MKLGHGVVDRRDFVAFLCLTISLAGSCHDGGGGSEQPLVVEAVFTAGEGAFPASGVPLNARLFIQCSVEIDPGSVSPESVRIETAGPDGPRRAEGEFSVAGNRIEFLPRLPERATCADAGLLRGARYDVVVPGLTERGTIRSRSGRVPGANFRVSFETRESEPLFEDASLAPFRAEAALVDLDGDGVLEGDGLPATPEPEEFFDLARVPVADAVPAGLVRAPSRFGYLLSEPVRPAALFDDADGDGRADGLRLENPDGTVVPARVGLSQSLLPGGGVRVLVSIEPRVRLREFADVFLVAGPLADFASPPNGIVPASAVFRTSDAPRGAEDAVIESFDSTEGADRTTTALWGTGSLGRLVSGSGLGGAGFDGAFDFDTLPEAGRVRRTSGTTAVFDADPDGILQFTSFRLPAGTELRCEGAVPALIFVTGDAEIAGTIRLAGRDGEVAIGRGQVTRGGRGGPGGGDGGNGNPNGTSALSPNGEGGHAAFGVTGTLPCHIGGGFRAGGCPGRRLSSGAGSGGGGGHRDAGASDNAVSPNSGLGGTPHGTADIAFLTGGSGGAAGGNDEDGLSFENDDPGGAGGGGGGALGLEIGGRLSFAGSIVADGGRGGGGFQQSGAGGGGAGGAIRIRAARIDPLETGSMTARGGLGGLLSSPGRPGGAGSPGRIRIETEDGSHVVDRTRFVFDPSESSGVVSEDVLGRSLARSRYYPTGALAPRYAFDGSDPSTGALSRASTSDLVLAAPAPPGAFARIVFFGALEDAARPFEPDLATESGPATDVSSLDGYPFLRFEIEFETEPDPFFPPRIEIESIRFRFSSE